MSRAGIAYVSIAFLFLLACQKNNLSNSESDFTSSNDILLADSQSNRLSYGDSVFSASVVGTEKLICPVSRPSQPGYFASGPGLDLDSITGRINVSESESGLRYRVYYLSKANQPIDSTTITISGIDYKDRIYYVASGTAEERFVAPVYNMTPSLPLPCANAGDNPGCKFDETDLNGDHIPDITGANSNKLIIDTATGIIDLKQSLDAGLFGPPAGPNPAINGRRKDITIYYRLNDSDTRTLKKITVRLVYFQSRALIPESMQLEISSRSQSYLVQPGSAASSGDDLTSLLYYYSTPKRPPLIVIVSGL
jgi:hypothetical protein